MGAEIGGVDLARPLSADTVDEIRHALFEFGVVFFRDQEITPEQHIAFSRRFGEINVNRFFKPVNGYPMIAEVRKDPDQQLNIGGNWHTDHSYDVAPAMGSLLYAREVPETGGDTLFASMYAAYDKLSPPIKALVEGLTATHDGEPVYRGRFGHDGGAKGYPRADHPIVRTHPVTGRKALFVNRNFTTRINGLSRIESDALLRMLWDHAETAEFQCRFRWEANSIAFWDNRCVQHHAMWDYFPQRRHGYRVTIEGDKPFFRA